MILYKPTVVFDGITFVKDGKVIIIED